MSVGELGTTAEQLERKLQDILELASIWNAVVLIDEADVSAFSPPPPQTTLQTSTLTQICTHKIFLEKRTRHDIVRNAMVGIFLRKLE